MNRALCAGALLALAWTACSAESTPTPDYQSGGTGGVADSATDTPPESAFPDAPADHAQLDADTEDASADDADVADVDFSYDATQHDQAACAETVVEVRQTPLAMYILLDRSGSMTFANKWGTAVEGMTQFVQAPGAAGMNLGLQYFPLETGHDCGGGGYAVPEVAMGLLPAHGADVIASLTAADPSGVTTPIEGALHGIVQFTRAYSASPEGAGQKVVGLLLTDGMPDGSCVSDTQALAAIAEDAYQGQPSIPIYVLGMSGADFAVLSAIAAAGGTSAAYSVTTGGAAAFLSTLEDIRAKAVGCDFAMPTAEAGVVDFDQVKVVYTPDGGTPQTLPHQPDSAHCGLGWYFDDNTSPAKVTLCPSTCNLVHQDPNARIDISLGCLGA